MNTAIDNEIEKLKPVAEKFLQLIQPGIVAGLGAAKAGEMCIEACLCAALDMPHGDRPTCVGSRVNGFAISLNDAPWSSDQARAAGMKRFGVAQIGSNNIDQEAFKENLAVKCMSKILPGHMRRISELEDEFSAEQKATILAMADQYEAVTTYAEVRKIVNDDKRVYGKKLVVGVVVGGVVGGGVGVVVGVVGGVVGVVGVVEKFREVFGDGILIELANAATETLVELKSPGCEFLSLCD